jgi:leader peptidase (prepilin peptidase)/N-methyltransferase
MVPAAIVDHRERRLPDRLVALSGVVVVLALVGAAAIGHPVAIGGVLLGACTMTLPILALHLVDPSAMGFGDVKASVVLGAALGTGDWRATLIALCLASTLGTLEGIVRRRRTVAFGVHLVAGSAAALVVSPTLLGLGG